MPECIADATWNGAVTDGGGTVSLGSGTWSGDYGTPDAPDVIDPEKLLAVGQAACSAMTVAYALDEAGFDPRRVDVDATLTLEIDEAGFTISAVDPAAEGRVPDATAAQFDAVVATAEQHWPVSKALGTPDVDLTASLAGCGTAGRRGGLRTPARGGTRRRRPPARRRG